MFTVSNESALRKKLLEIHDFDGVTFDSESVLALIERISSLVSSGTDGPHNGPTGDVLRSLGFMGPNSIPDTLRSMLHKISCELNCNCSGENTEVTTMEIMKLLSGYDWEAKITIVLATFVVEYARFNHMTKLYKHNHVGELVAILKQIPENFDAMFHEMKSTFATIIKISIKMTRFIAKFSNLPSKYISNEVEPMADASNQIPIAAYVITKSVVASVSRLTQILGQAEISSYTETRDFIGFEQKIINLHDVFQEQLELCHIYIEEKKQTNLMVKLRLKFDKTAVYANNQKILQLLFNNKYCVLPLAFGPDKTKEVSVETLKGKTVLLFISDLDVTNDEIFILTKLYQESRNNHELQYEIVWLPIVENIERNESLEITFEDMKRRMPWHSLQHPRLLKAGVVRYVKEEWHYSKKPILVALDPKGKVANPNVFQMVSTWGNTAYPFTQTRELDIWSRKEWSLDLLVGGIDQRISKWIKEQKVICLYGGNDYDWVDNFITTARDVQEFAGIKLEMVYIGNNMTDELTDILNERSLFWEAESTNYFWRRIELMGRSESHHGGRISTTKEAILNEVLKINWIRQDKRGWALISQGAGIGAGKIALGKGDVILKALTEFEMWSVEAKLRGFVTALNGYLVHRHHIPEMHVCHECHRPI